MSQHLILTWVLYTGSWAALNQAKEFHERALHIRFEIFGPQHVKVVDIYKNLSAVHINQGYIH